MALFQGLGRLLLEAEDKARPGPIVDRDFVDAHSAGFDAFGRAPAQSDLDTVLAATGSEPRADRGDGAGVGRLAAHDRVLGHGADPAPHAVADHRGGRQPAAAARHDRQARRGRLPGARALQRAGRPHDGHLGEDAAETFLDALDREFGFVARASTASTSSTPSAPCATERRRCSSRMGGNFVAATPDTEVTEAALAACALTVQVSTKLNRSHVVTGAHRADPADARAAPTCDLATDGIEQQVSVEDSMSMVHCPRGSLHAARATICAAKSRSSAGWRANAVRTRTPGALGRSSSGDYDRIRDAIARVVPGCYGLQRAGSGARRLRPAPPAARRARIPHRHRQSQLRGQPNCAGCRCRRAG